MEIFKKLKFVRKIQAGFFILGMVGTIVIFLSYFQINKMVDIKNQIFQNYVEPQKCMKKISSGFQKTQYIMMQLSMPVFASKFKENADDYGTVNNDMQKQIDSLKNIKIGLNIEGEINSIDSLWNQYKSFVADAILSASATHNYDMAADVATSDGEAVGVKLSNALSSLQVKLEANADKLNSNIESDVNTTVWISILGAVLGTIISFFFIFYLHLQLLNR